MSLLKRTRRPTLVGTFDLRERAIEPVAPGVLDAAVALAEAMFWRGDEAPPRARLDWLRKNLARFIGYGGPDTRRTFRLCLFLVTALGPLLVLRVGFVGRPLGERLRILERVETSPLSPALLALKAILCLHYFEHPDAGGDIGAPAGCMLPEEA